MHVIVVGAGVVGLLTAMECAITGARVTLIDKGDVPCPGAASNDRHRVVRALHLGNGPLTAAAARAHERWVELQDRLGARFYCRIGALTAMAPPALAANLQLLGAAGVPAVPLLPGDLTRRYPHIRFRSGQAAILETSTGAVLADQALTAMAGWLAGQPDVRVCLGRRVCGVEEPATVRLADGSVLRGDRVVLAAGPWSRDLLPASAVAGLALYRQSTLYCYPRRHAAAWETTPAMPAIGVAEGAWLVPPVAGTPMRLSSHSACREEAGITGHDTPEFWRDHLVDLFRTLLTGFDASTVVGAGDGYYLADAASGDPVLTTLGAGTVWAHAACGGSSFKFAPLIARSIASRVTGTDVQVTGLDFLDHPRVTPGPLEPGPLEPGTLEPGTLEKAR